jgi:hypothetical protein
MGVGSLKLTDLTIDDAGNANFKLLQTLYKTFNPLDLLEIPIQFFKVLPVEHSADSAGVVFV